MIDELKSNVTLHPICLSVLIIQTVPSLSKRPLHPIIAPKFQTVQTLLPRVLRCENFCGRSAND